MLFPYENYQILEEPLKIYYPAGQESQARWISERIVAASSLLAQLMNQPIPAMQLLFVTDEDWHLAPHSDPEEIEALQPYWTDSLDPVALVIPTAVDPIFGDVTPEKFAFLLHHELGLAFLEADPRPWPNDYPLWADEWQLKFMALWLSQKLDK